MSVLFSTAYLPPLSYFNRCIAEENIILESHEHFVKQTFRNRCYIGGPNGKQSLIIPIHHDDLANTPISELKMSFDSRWNHIHWKSITSAYRNAPYFEFYEDEFHRLFINPSEKLFDFNLNLLKLLFRIFKSDVRILFTSQYEKQPAAEDVRNFYHPKKNSIIVKEYYQVFSERNGFIQDLSVIDYLFNKGNKLPAP